MIKTLLRIILVLFCLISCYQNEPLPESSCNRSIKAGDIGAVKTCIQGNWKIHYCETQLFEKQWLSNSVIQLKENDSLYYIFEGDIVAETIAAWEVSKGTEIHFKNWRDFGYTWKINSLDSDTLFITEGGCKFALTRSAFTPEMNCGMLVNKALNQIRSCIRGRWELTSRGGGYSGNDITYYTGRYVIFKDNDSVEYIQEGASHIHDKINWMKWETPHWETHYSIMLNSTDTFPNGLGVFYVHEVSLYLTDYSDDGYLYELVRDN